MSVPPKQAPPPWASMFSPARYRRFMNLVTQEVGRRGLHGYLDPDGVYIVARGVTGEPYTVALEDLARRCQGVAPDEWAAVIRHHFTSLEEIQQRSAERRTWTKSFQRVRKRLKIRIYPEAFREQGMPLVCRPVAPGIIAALVYDFPNTLSAVTPEERACWRPSDDALFQLALDNVQAEELPERRTTPLPGGAVETTLSGDSLFTTTHLLCIERHFDQVPPYGWLVAAPHQHTVLALPIEDARVVPAIDALLLRIRTLFDLAGYPLSPHLYWRRAGELIWLPTRWEGDAIHFEPGARFVDEVLTPLSAIGTSD